MDPQNPTRSPTRLSGLTSLLGSGAWAIREASHRQLVSDYNTYLKAGPAGHEQIEKLRAARDTRAEVLDSAQAQAPGVAVLALYGTILPRGNMMVELCGAASPHSFAEDVQRAANDPNVTSIILDIDSGGGAVSGIDVAAEAVRRASQIKPTTAVCNTTACSAAYWIAAQAREVVITPAGEMGSIGVIGTHVDESKLMDEAGLVVTYVRSTPGKALGQPTEAMSGDILTDWQSQVDRIHALFIADVALGRKRSEAEVAERWATGAVWFGQEAVTAGLADRVGTLSSVVAEHLQQASDQQARQARSQRRAADPTYGRLSAEADRLDTLLAAPLLLPKDAQTEVVAASQRLWEAVGTVHASHDYLDPDYAALCVRATALQEAAHALATPTPPEAPDMKTVTLTAHDGTVHEIDATPEALQAFLSGQLTAQTALAQTAQAGAVDAALAEANAQVATVMTDLGAAFGLTAEQAINGTGDAWIAAAARAGAVTDYRAALLSELETLAVTVDGNTGAAAQIVKLAGQASLTDLQTTVTAYRDRRDTLVPTGRQSAVPETSTPEVNKPKRSAFNRN
ncbi:S49 family peptidase [Deinococcus marmoris]|uniref:Peptidase S49 n=1 Tax=Deinococcus marmoris TaxID=249408 RepID=A0A1U7P4W5_9DEIO|nr:S49 family peptidase [Deinococcus marmoris]OLV20213.1 Peptidase S49 [Deinococcus marmoris]